MPTQPNWEQGQHLAIFGPNGVGKKKATINHSSKFNLNLKSRGTAEAGAIIIAIACGVIVLAIFLEWLVSGKGLLTQQRSQDSPQEVS